MVAECHQLSGKLADNVYMKFGDMVMGNGRDFSSAPSLSEHRKSKECEIVPVEAI